MHTCSAAIAVCLKVESLQEHQESIQHNFCRDQRAFFRCLVCPASLDDPCHAPYLEDRRGLICWQDNIQGNCGIFKHGTNAAQVRQLDWNDTSLEPCTEPAECSWTEADRNELESLDVILAADVVYDETATEALFKCAANLLQGAARHMQHPWQGILHLSACMADVALPCSTNSLASDLRELVPVICMKRMRMD